MQPRGRYKCSDRTRMQSGAGGAESSRSWTNPGQSSDLATREEGSREARGKAPLVPRQGVAIAVNCVAFHT